MYFGGAGLQAAKQGGMTILFRLKQALFWLGYRIDQWLPARLCVAMRNRCAPWGKPILDVVELHLADHCNLNCTGCLHFTPLAEKLCARPEVVEADLAALRRKFRYIRHVTLLGGEPLLNPDYGKIVEVVNRVSPESLITAVTNGVLLKNDALDLFLDVCKRFSVRVKWTIYPPLRSRRQEIVARFKEAGVRLFTIEVGDFYVKMNPNGGDPKAALRFCRKTTYCPYLRDGRIYTCAQAFHIRDYIKLYEKETDKKSEMVPSRGLAVYDETTDGWSVLEYLMTPCETCRFCADSFRYIPWSQSLKHYKEWVR